MKRCSTCNRTFTDPNLRFCIEDGTPLTDLEPDDDATVITPRDTQENNWNTAAAYQPPRSYVAPGGDVRKRRRAWPWIVGLAGAFILGILAIGIVALVVAPRVAQRVEQAQREVNREIAPTTNSNTNSNTNATENVDAPVPTDHEQVLTQLKDIENEWTVANLNADKKKLDRILADDFVVKDDNGQLISKADYLRTIQRDTQTEKWEFNDLNLKLTGDRAALSGTITYISGDQRVVDQFTDKFVWRDGRWQATGSEVKRGEQDNVDNH